MAEFEILHGDCLEQLAAMPDCCVDALVSDPPYGLSTNVDVEAALRTWLAGEDYKHSGKGFMGKEWDSFVPGPRTWREILRVLKPGGHGLVFAGSRTVDVMGIALRLAGFEVRDALQWVYFSGFPKSLDVAKAIDKQADHWRGRQGAPLENPVDGQERFLGEGFERRPKGAPITAEAAAWEGWGTALKPAYEPIILVRKPFEGTVADNVKRWGTGAINIDGCRIGTEKRFNGPPGQGGTVQIMASKELSERNGYEGKFVEGRWPSNMIFGEGATEMLDTQSGVSKSQPCYRSLEASKSVARGEMKGSQKEPRLYTDEGGASRFFYCPKASTAEREAGLGDDFSEQRRTDGRKIEQEMPHLRTSKRRNTHSTVKPIALMRYLVRLITPPSRWECKNKECPGESRAATSAVQDLRDDHVKAEEHLLLEGLSDNQGHGSSANQAPESLRVVQAGIQTQGESVEVLQSPMQSESHRTQTQKTGRPQDHSRLHPVVDAGPSDGSEGRVCASTSSRNGAAPGPVADSGRGGPSSKREEGRQQDREPSALGQSSARRTTEAATKEHRVSVLRSGAEGLRPCPACGGALSIIKDCGIVLDPFTGSGSTGCAAVLEGFDYLGCEREAEYVRIAEARITYHGGKKA